MPSQSQTAARLLAQAKEATSQVALLAQVPQSNFQPGASRGGTFLCEVTEVLPVDAYDGQRYNLQVLSSQTKEAVTGMFIRAAVLAEDGDTALAIGDRVAVTLTDNHTPIIMSGRPTDSSGDGFPVEAFSWLNDVDVAES